MKTLSALVLFLAGAACGTAPALAESTSPSSGVTVKKTTAKKTPGRKAPAAKEKKKEPDVSGMQPVAFDCELGNKLTIYSSTGNDQQIALQWNKRTHHMTRMHTTTGAHRFENAESGLVWIGIPAKGMLLDSKKGRQLANECKSPEQQKIAEQKF